MNYKILCIFPEDRCLGPLVTAHLRRDAPLLWIRSAAWTGLEQAPIHPNAMLVGVSQGLDLWGERSREVDESLLDWADHILVWSANHLEELRRRMPGRQDQLSPLDPEGLLTPWPMSCDEAELRARLPAIETWSDRCAQRLDNPTTQLVNRAP